MSTEETTPTSSSASKPSDPPIVARASKALKITQRMVLRVAAVVAAVGVLVSGVIYIRDMVRRSDEDRAKITQTKEQSKEAAGSLAESVELLSEQVRQNHEDIAAIRRYLADMSLKLELADARARPRIASAGVGASSKPLDLPAPPKVGPEPKKVDAKAATEAFEK